MALIVRFALIPVLLGATQSAGLVVGQSLAARPAHRAFRNNDAQPSLLSVSNDQLAHLRSSDAKTAIRNESLPDAAEAYNDVDSTFTALIGNLAPLRVYWTYLEPAVWVARHHCFGIRRAAYLSWIFLHAQQDYPSVQLGDLNPADSYMTSANPLNLAVGAMFLH